MTKAEYEEPNKRWEPRPGGTPPLPPRTSVRTASAPPRTPACATPRGFAQNQIAAVCVSRSRMVGDWSGDCTPHDLGLRRLPVPAGGDLARGPGVLAVRPVLPPRRRIARRARHHRRSGHHLPVVQRFTQQFIAAARPCHHPPRPRHPRRKHGPEGIEHSYLHDGRAGEGTAYRQQALALSQRIAALAARRAQETLLQFSKATWPLSGKPPDPNAYSKLPQPVT
jgi:hypothetical protein